MVAKKSKKATLTRPQFAVLLADVKSRIQTAQTRAMLAVNAELVRLYWDIGQIIDQRQQHEGWGAGVIPRLAQALKNELPEVKGFSERNIGLMVRFYREYPDAAILQAPLAKIPVAIFWAIPWYHHTLLLQKVKELEVRQWYMEQTISNGWSGNLLALQIDADAHLRQGRAVSNFDAVLPKTESDLAQQVLKDPYIYDF